MQNVHQIAKAGKFEVSTALLSPNVGYFYHQTATNCETFFVLTDYEGLTLVYWTRGKIIYL